MQTFNSDPWKEGVSPLIPERHDGLVQNIAKYAYDAGIDPNYVFTKSTEFLNADEIQWCKDFSTHRARGHVGLAFVGTRFSPPIMQRMSAMCALLMRNFKRARLFDLGRLLDEIEESGYPPATCLFIPNFIAHEKARSDSKSARAMGGAVINRAGKAGVQTVICIPSVEIVATHYGEIAADVVRHQYVKFDGGV